MRLEVKVLHAITHLKTARTMQEWTQAIREYNRAQDRYMKAHHNYYVPYEAVNTPDRAFSRGYSHD